MCVVNFEFQASSAPRQPVPPCIRLLLVLWVVVVKAMLKLPASSPDPPNRCVGLCADVYVCWEHAGS